MPAPFKWVADAAVSVGTSPGEPETLGLGNGRFLLGYHSGAPDRNVSIAYNGSTSTAIAATTTVASDAGLSRSGVSLAQTTTGQIIIARSVEPTAGGGNLEDVDYQTALKLGNVILAVDLDDTVVYAAADQQLHPAVAAGKSGRYAIAWADYVGPDQIYLTSYSATDTVSATFQVNTTPGLYNFSVGTLNYRPVSVEGLSNGNYVVGWTGSDFIGRIRVVTPFGAMVSSEIALTPAGTNSLWPDIAELADGRFVVATFGGGSGRFSIYEADGTVSVAATAFTSSVSSGFNARQSAAALPDGRFVIVWVNFSNEVRGQMFLADGTTDGAEFAVADVTIGNQGRPSVSMLADGRFIVAWETDESGTPSVKYTVFDPRTGGQILSGTADDDAYDGTNFADAMYSGLGDDTLRGYGGADYLRGGDDRDTLNGGDNGDLLFGEQQADTLFGENGDDFLYGGLGEDTLSGGAGNDTLYGEESDDTLNGDADNDVVIGGDGNDLIYGGDGADSIDGGKGNDTVYAGVGADFAAGGDGNDTLIGEAGNDQLYGGAGVDSIDGGADADTIYGGADGDFIQGGAGGDILIGEAGADDINGGDNDDSIDGGADGDTLRGGNGVDFIQGGTGADSLFGDADPDTLNGGADGDTLTGGAGGDTMTGGTGFDVFFFAIGSGVDVITDFEDNVDKINLSTYAGANFGNTFIAQSGANTVVSFAGAFADQVILVNFTATNLTAGDFVF